MLRLLLILTALLVAGCTGSSRKVSWVDLNAEDRRVAGSAESDQDSLAAGEVGASSLADAELTSPESLEETSASPRDTEAELADLMEESSRLPLPEQQSQPSDFPPEWKLVDHQEQNQTATVPGDAAPSESASTLPHEDETSPQTSSNSALTSADHSEWQPIEPGALAVSPIVTVGGTENESTEGAELAPLPMLGSPMEESPDERSEAEPKQPSGLSLDEVISSVYGSYPLLEAAFYSRNIVAGKQLSAQGEFDLRVHGASENEVLGFYQNYRQSIGVIQPTYMGGEVFAGYRVGNGLFQPWYKGRETNEGGEFRAGVLVPLARDRQFDRRRAEIMRTDYERQLVEPDIQAQLISFVQEASYAYWTWVATGERYRIAREALDLALRRVDALENQVKEELLRRPELIDNNRLIAERRARLAEIDRRLRQSASRLSLFYRDVNGEPLIPNSNLLPGFPDLQEPIAEQMEMDMQLALQSRPEMTLLNLTRRQLEVDLAQATNEMRPSIDAMMVTSQDIGQRASAINDKGQFEMEASVFLDVPLQRRKAQGKIQSAQGKLAQLNAKRRILQDRISVDVQLAYAGLVTAYQQVLEAEEAVVLANDLARRENINLEEGFTDVLTVALREQFAVEAAERAVDAKAEFFRALADYRAALGQDQTP